MHPRHPVLTALALALSLAALPAGAQLCAGLPGSPGGGSLAGRLQSGGGDHSLGAEASYNVPGPFSLMAGFDRAGDDDARETILFGSVAAEFPRLATSIGPEASACGLVGVRHAEVESVIELTQVPIGFGVGTRLRPFGPLQAGVFVIPQLLISSLSVDESVDPGFEDSLESDIAVRGGGLLQLGNLFVRAELEQILTSQGADPLFGIAAGIRF
jgi:hypothetical protein